jgi:peptidoglycan/xylan/chitin deacetylase (PgdA/CDA1 family)
VQRHPDIFQQILKEGHTVGNHTLQHLNGWKTDTDTYLQNVQLCANLVPGNLFRPPYGRLRTTQATALKKNYQIVLWDVLSGDFDRGISPQKCFNNITRHARPGSIVVLHDSLKAERHLRYALPALLDFYAGKGWRFERV